MYPRKALFAKGMVCDLCLGKSEGAGGRAARDEGLRDGVKGVSQQWGGRCARAGEAWCVLGRAEGSAEGGGRARMLAPTAGFAGFEELFGGKVFQLGEGLLRKEDIEEVSQLGGVERLDVVGLHEKAGVHVFKIFRGRRTDGQWGREGF